MPISRSKLTRLWETAFAPYVKTVKDRFAFLETYGYKAPKVSVHFRECYIVYWGDRRTLANVAVYHDLGSEPLVFIVPLWLNDETGITRRFGLHEAVAVLDPLYAKSSPLWPGPANETSKLERIWIDWYARFLKAHLAEAVNPSTQLLEAIENRRIK